jgi:hypothetical protein
MIQLYISYDVVSKYNTRTQELGLMVQNFIIIIIIIIISIFFGFSTITVRRLQVVVELIQLTLTQEIFVYVFLKMFYVPTF